MSTQEKHIELQLTDKLTQLTEKMANLLKAKEHTENILADVQKDLGDASQAHLKFKVDYAPILSAMEEEYKNGTLSKSSLSEEYFLYDAECRRFQKEIREYSEEIIENNDRIQLLEAEIKNIDLEISLEAKKIHFIENTRFLLFSPPSAKHSKKSSLQEKLDPYPTTPKMGHSKGG